MKMNILSAWIEHIKRWIKRVKSRLRDKWRQFSRPPVRRQIVLNTSNHTLRNGETLTLEVSNASPALIDEMVELERLAYGGKVMWKGIDFFEDIAVHPRTFYLQAFIDEKLVGFIGCRQDRTDMHISNLAVLPSEQGKGIGRILLHCAIEQLPTIDRKCVTLEVRLTNRAAQRFYTREGFKVIKRIESYYTDNKEDALVMRACY